jgi:hypothetical protein
MRPHTINTSLDYLRRIAPEHLEAATKMLEALPAGWCSAIPRTCRQPDGAIPWLLIPYALLALIDPLRFAPSHRTVRLAELIHQLLYAAEHDKHTPRKGTTMTDEFFPETTEVHLKAREKYLEGLKIEVAHTTTGDIIRPAR